MGTPNRDPQEYSRNLIEYEDPGRCNPIIFLLYSWGSQFGSLWFSVSWRARLQPSTSHNLNEELGGSGSRPQRHFTFNKGPTWLCVAMSVVGWGSVGLRRGLILGLYVREKLSRSFSFCIRDPSLQCSCTRFCVTLHMEAVHSVED